MRDALFCAGAETMLKRVVVLLALFFVAGIVGNGDGFAGGAVSLGTVRLEYPS